MNIDFTNLTALDFEYLEERFNYFADKLSKYLNLPGNEFLEVDIVDNLKIQGINRDYRHVDKPTDVISFAFNDDVEGEIKISNPEVNFLGNIFISYERCEQQANELNHSFDREMYFLFLHGCLHLLGYDHQNEEEAEIMYGIQRKMLEGENLW